ncbi:DEAD-box ATP-dependent RNA helicase 41 isoform X2 [Lathyrus oleraceus]|uniref:DEAD-box ATP-dependent RNA helicase 41 isoform X2 n=1 Tax=Pisum sativum TaxID=3888 RepID=UPI0021D0C9FA|nr:DEAD-box ATP-dependent RNA helicase 41 isoform X2 [Pisum sativum]
MNNNMADSIPIHDDPSTIPSLSTDQPNGNDVKLSSKDQRDALPGEPKCTVCGRYGEYICDETDDDVCSLECKQSVLCRISKSSSRVGDLPPPKRLPAADVCFYVRDTDCKSGTPSSIGDQSQAELLRKKLDIHVKGFVSAPVLSFASCNLPDKLLHNIEGAGYEMPTPVQMQAIPAASMGKNMLVLADTGSGKSASFLIPIISRCASHRLTYVSDKKKPLAMVLTPTRELSIQVEEHAKLLGKGLPFKTALVVGGDAMARQIYRIQQGVELIVGTPGRLVDLLTKHEIDLDDVTTFVVDEVDCMLQRGFRDQVLEIFTALSQPQVLMYSATMSDSLENMANSLAKDTVIITVGEPNRPNKAVKQLAIWVESKQKKQKLFDILTSQKHFKPPVVIYVGSRLGADLLANAISVSTGMRAVSIHGEKSMTERREIMQSFMVGEFPVVVATGVLGRGVDLLGVRQVIVFDMPNSIKEYVHQIGRASRMGEEGQAIVFVNDENKNVFAELVDVLKSGAAAIPRELINSQYATGFFSGGKGSKKRKHR